MNDSTFGKSYEERHSLRFNKTIEFVTKYISKNDEILDLGPVNPLSNMIREKGFQISNTAAELDLDFNSDVVEKEKFTVLTAFEIFEHLVSPFPLLYKSKATKLIASVPLKLWFANAYWNEEDSYDRHYHEFEPRQFDMLLKKAGWHIKDSEKWASSTNQIGLRPLLRRFTPRYYLVYCER